MEDTPTPPVTRIRKKKTRANAWTSVVFDVISKKGFSRNIYIGIAFVLILCAVLFFSVFRSDSKNQGEKKGSQGEAGQTEDIIQFVSKIALLPTDTPQIIRVLDIKKLNQNEPFLKRAENGDVILLFQTQAILFRPSIQKIVAMTELVRDGAQRGNTVPSSPR